MPLVIRPRAGGSLRLLAASAALLTVACGVTSGGAHAATTTTTTSTTTSASTGCPGAAGMSQVFAGFGDTANYVLAPGGSFEAGSAAWTLNGNAVVVGNDPFALNSGVDVQTVTIKPTTSVMSPAFCVDSTNPFLRLVAQKATKGSLRVELMFADPSNGSATYKTAGSVIMGGANQNGDYSAWAASPKLNLATALPLAKSSTGTLSVKVRLTADSNAGNWQVDDVFVDPFRAG